jgi:Mg/Co/Ni transporter MgtE
MTGKVPTRVKVTGPPSITPAHRAVTNDAAAEVGDAAIRALIRRQLRVGLLVCGCVCGSLALLPLLFVLAPSVGTTRIWGVPLVWLVLGVLVYPILVMAGSWYARRAERNERDFGSGGGHP